MDYEANAAQQKRSNRVYSEFMIDIQEFQKVSNEVFTAKAQDEDFDTKCNYLHKLLDQIHVAAPDLKQILPSKDEVTGTATRI